MLARQAELEPLGRFERVEGRLPARRHQQRRRQQGQHQQRRGREAHMQPAVPGNARAHDASTTSSKR
ncbi:MAG: hypothetical protein IPM99_19835 [Rubrivivax sp.]|nr:hypothetical protein [Rubrivivax sp.]